MGAPRPQGLATSADMLLHSLCPCKTTRLRCPRGDHPHSRLQALPQAAPPRISLISHVSPMQRASQGQAFLRGVSLLKGAPGQADVLKPRSLSPILEQPQNDARGGPGTPLQASRGPSRAGSHQPLDSLYRLHTAAYTPLGSLREDAVYSLCGTGQISWVEKALPELPT